MSIQPERVPLDTDNQRKRRLYSRGSFGGYRIRVPSPAASLVLVSQRRLSDPRPVVGGWKDRVCLFPAIDPEQQVTTGNRVVSLDPAPQSSCALLDSVLRRRE